MGDPPRRPAGLPVLTRSGLRLRGVRGAAYGTALADQVPSSAGASSSVASSSVTGSTGSVTVGSVTVGSAAVGSGSVVAAASGGVVTGSGDSVASSGKEKRHTWPPSVTSVVAGSSSFAGEMLYAET